MRESDDLNALKLSTEDREAIRRGTLWTRHTSDHCTVCMPRGNTPQVYAETVAPFRFACTTCGTATINPGLYFEKREQGQAA